MTTAADLAFYAAGCWTGQPRYEQSHPDITLFTFMANPPEIPQA